MLLERVQSCMHCAKHLPLGPRPILQLHPKAHILIASQAPGRVAHASGVPFQDASGRRLRAWMGISEHDFYDPSKIAILPMGFCYPGRGKGGDLPPRSECAPLWRQVLLDQLANIRLTLVIGAHAQRWHLPSAKTLTDQVRQGLEIIDQANTATLVLPHPSPRNNPWLKRNPWFEDELIPRLQRVVVRTLRTAKPPDRKSA